MKRPALQDKEVVVLRMAFRARKVFGTFEKQGPRLLVRSGGQNNAPSMFIMITIMITTSVLSRAPDWKDQKSNYITEQSNSIFISGFY